jgi:hypothetical protein
MAISNMTTFDAALKEHYNNQVVENLVYKNNPLLALLPKYEAFGGRNMPLPLVYGNPQNRSATFSNAVGLSGSSSIEAFTLTRVKNYSLAFIDGETLKASEGDKNAFVSALTTEIDGAMQSIGNDIAYGLGRDSSGYRAQVNAEPSVAATTVITLKSAEDVVGFEIGQDIVIYSAKSGGSQRTFDGAATNALVSAVDRSAGTITLNDAYDASGDIAADDFIFVAGDRGIKISGLEDWIPDSAPSSTAFFGVDRSVDTNRLGGVRTTGTGMPIEEALIECAQDIAREGGSPDYAFVNFKQYAKLLKSMSSKVQYIDLDVNGVISFRGVLIHGAHGPIKVVPDRTIRDARAYLLQMDTWKLCSLGSLVHMLDEDGSKFLRQSSADAYEVRIGSYAQLGCVAPGFNGVVTLDA